MIDIKAIQKGDRQAFEFLVKETHASVYRLLYRFVQNKNDAEDLAQEVYLEVYKSIHKFQEKSSIYTWLYRISVNKALNFLKKEKKHKKNLSIIQGGEDENTLELQLEADRTNEAEFHLENSELASILNQAINNLPDRQRSAFILHNHEGQSYQSIAEILNTSLSSVESLIFRARAALRKNLGEYYKKNYR